MAIIRFRITPYADVVHELEVKSLDGIKASLGDGLPTNRSVIVLNIPLYLQEEDVKNLFLRFGSVSEVSFPKELKPSKAFPVTYGCRLACVTFDSAECAREVFRRDDDCRVVGLSRPSGVEKWRQAYVSLIREPEMSRAEADDVIQRFKELLKNSKLRKTGTGEPDEDGWITVTRSQKRKVIPKGKSYLEKLSAKEMDKRKRASKQSETPFYRFQMRDSKKRQIEELQRKFEEDKKRIKLMMESRKFRPF
uniref:RRM domain-containing protein n=1 Tax=Trichuris muris TaxID=70415 RepID=A0A5S6QQ02_TRIMR